MKLSSLLLLSLGSVNAQEENTDLSQLQALLKLPGAQELLASLKEKDAESSDAPTAAPVESPVEAPVETPAEVPVDTPVEAPVEVAESAPADQAVDVDIDDSVRVIPGQMAAAEEGESVVTNPVIDTSPTLLPGVEPLNQTSQLNATVTPELVTVTTANQEVANVTVTTASAANVTTTILPSNATVIADLNPLQPVEQLEERLEDEDEPESAPPTETPVAEVPVAPESETIVEESTEAVEEIDTDPAVSETATSEPDVSAVFNNLSAEEQAALLAKLQATTQPDIDLKMSNTDMILGQINAGAASLATEVAVNATQAAVNATEATPSEPSIVEDVTEELGAYGSRAEEVADAPIMMTGTNPEVYGGEPQEPEIEEPVLTEDSAIEDMETQMEENLDGIDTLDDLSDETEEDDEYYDSYDGYEDDDDWEDDYDDDEDGWDEWDEDGDGLDIYEIDQDDELDEVPRNHYDVAYREKALEDYENILEQQEEAFETEQEAEAAQYNFAFFMILFITVFTGGYYAYGKIREKFFPASSSVSDYITKKWRYWDQEQQYTPLPKEDGDVKQSVSSEPKADEDWDNENW